VALDAPPLEDQAAGRHRDRGVTGGDRMGRRAIFMDRDGTVCDEVGYVNHVDRVRLLPRAAAAIRAANEAGFQTVVVTNQAGVARGYFEESLVEDAHERVRQLLAEEGARLDGIYYCPHHPEVGSPAYRKSCTCRKPSPGLLERARDEMGIDLQASYMIGDTVKDIEAGHRAGATKVLVLTGYGKGELEYQSHAWRVKPDHVAADLHAAIEWILTREAAR
jgi:D-glycero-D-manno-heptose 1,7-bisphosphate phosphatase